MCFRIFRGGTFQSVKRYVLFCTFAVPAIRIFGIYLQRCSSPSAVTGFCSSQVFLIMIMAAIGWFAFVYLTSLVYRLFLKRFLARRFPMSCGNRSRRCNFTGKSSKTLSELLLTIDSELPTEEVSQDEQNTVFRFLDDIRDAFLTYVNPAASWEYVFVGSMAEKYGIPLSYKRANMLSFVIGLISDIDVMLCFDHEAMDASFSGREGNILIAPIVSPFLGFAHLSFRSSGDVIKSNEIMEQARNAVSRTKVTNFPRLTYCFRRCESFGGLKYGVKGPAINVSIQNIADFDITPCIKCREWPPLSDWPTRQRCWPSQEDVTRIVSHGCHLVAKPEPSDKEQTSWRFSFSVAEVELSKLVPNTARKCLLALKVILKEHLQPVVAGITSYHLKTIFLNTLKRTPVNFWVDENIEDCFFLLLNEIHDGLVSRNCLHFWFRSVNFFGQFNDPELVDVLIKKLERIAENPAPFIYDDGCCCLYPCCTRERLYDCRGRRINNLDDEVPICVEHANEHERDRSEQASHVVSVECDLNHERGPGNPISSLESMDKRKVPLGTSEHAVIINVHPDHADNEIDGTIDDDDNGDGGDERRPILYRTSSPSKYGAIKL